MRHWVTLGYTELHEAIHRVTRGYRGLNETTLSYMSPQRVTRGCTELPDATMGLQKVTLGCVASCNPM